MVVLPSPILLDTNIFILGHLDPTSPEATTLDQIAASKGVELVLSNELVDQIRRVARRVGGKEWAGLLINRLWQDFTILFVTISDEEKRAVESATEIPREDIGIYLAAIQGGVQCMVSSNHEFVRQTAKAQNLFECLTSPEFNQKYGW